MKRRSFLSFLIGAPITRLLPWRAIARIAPAPVAARINATFAEIVRETLRAFRPALAANLTESNALLRHLTTHRRR